MVLLSLFWGRIFFFLVNLIEVYEAYNKGFPSGSMVKETPCKAGVTAMQESLETWV